MMIITLSALAGLSLVSKILLVILWHRGSPLVPHTYVDWALSCHTVDLPLLVVSLTRRE
jgi:hypothetical protein